MSEQLFHDLSGAITRGDPREISDILHDIRRSGLASSPTRTALVEPLLQHPDWTVRQAAIWVLCVRWSVPHLREVAWRFWEQDPEEEVNCIALLGWSHYPENIGTPAAGETLLKIMLDESREDRVRACAYSCLFTVCQIPGVDRPRISHKVTERTDWALVWRLVGGLGVDLSPYRPPPGARRV